MTPLAVTTSKDPDPATVARAQALAERWSLPFLTRRSATPEQMLAERARALLVVMRERAELQDASGRFTWTPGMAQLRLKALERGEGDSLLEVAGLREGERVIDATLGFAQDAVLAARAVGPAGKVVGVEASLPLFLVVSLGLEGWDPGPRSCRVEPVFGEAGAFLQQQPQKSADVVLFDPMFARPRKAQPGFELLRRHADYAPLTRSALDAAVRVARRAVVVKASRYSDELTRLGLRPLERSRYADVAWARIDVAQAGPSGARGP